jgi:hypothetical protein
MYKSLLKWVNVPFSIKPFIKRSGTGEPVYGQLEEALCYPVAKTEKVVSMAGAEVLSSHQLYLKGTTRIDAKDKVVFEGTERDIKSIQSFYRNGVVDCKVVYL